MLLRRRTRPRRLLLALLFGVLAAAAHPPFGLWPLAFVASVPLLFAADPGDAGGNVLVGLVAGVSFWLPVLFWVTHTFRVYGGLPWIAAIGIWVLFAAILATLDFVPLLFLHGRALRWGAGPALAAFPFLWMAQEWWRGWHFTGFPWALTGSALVPRPELLAPARLGGGWLLSGLVVGVSAALVALAGGRDRRRLRRGGAIALGAIVVVFVLAPLVPPGRPVGELRVAVLQPNVPQLLRWSGEEVARIYVDLLRSSEELARETRPELLVWPESATPYSFDRHSVVRADVTELARSTGTAILFNTAREVDEDTLYNSARVVLPDGRVSEPYDKIHLVPFGEYVPARWLFGWTGKLVQEIGDFRPGSEPRLLPVTRSRSPTDGAVEAGVAVCYEAVYPDVFRRETRAGADLLVTVTNDGWYGGLGAEDQHWNGAVLQAIANGRSLVRAAITGISGIVAADGEVLGRIRLGERGTLVAVVPLRAGLVPATRLGPLFPALGGLVAACAILLARSRKRSAPSPVETPARP